MARKQRTAGGQTGDGLLRDLSDLVTDITPETLAPSSLERLKGINTDNLPIVNGNVRLGVPVKGIPKIMAVGQNYLNHILKWVMNHQLSQSFLIKLLAH